MKLLTEDEQIQQLMGAFFQAGGVKRYKGPISNAVIEVFVYMLLDAQRCLNDTTWDYRPEPGDPPVKALLSQMNLRIIERLADLNKQNTCIEFAIERYMDHLKQAILTGKAPPRES